MVTRQHVLVRVHGLLLLLLLLLIFGFNIRLADRELHEVAELLLVDDAVPVLVKNF